MKYQIAMFSRTLSTLLTGGLPLVPSLETASHSINSFKISSNVGYASNRVREGRSLSYSLEETNFSRSGNRDDRGWRIHRRAAGHA